MRGEGRRRGERGREEERGGPFWCHTLVHTHIDMCISIFICTCYVYILMCTHTQCRMVDDLNRLLNYASNQPKPLILVSSDYSTVVSRFYTLLYEQ